MRVLDKSIVLLFPFFFLGSMILKGNVQEFRDSIEIKRPLLFTNWCVDGLDFQIKEDEYLFSIYIYKDDPKSQSIEIISKVNDVCQYLEIDSTSTQNMFYVVNSLDCVFCQNDIMVTFLYLMKDKLGGLEPFKLTLVSIYKGQIYKFWGIISQHPDWEWEDYYEFYEDSKLKDNSMFVYNWMINRWLSIIRKYKQEYYNIN